MWRFLSIPRGRHAQCGELAAERIEPRDQLSMPFIIQRRIKRFDIEAAVGLKFAAPDLMDMFKTLSVDYRDQFLLRERFALKGLAVDLTIAN